MRPFPAAAAAALVVTSAMFGGEASAPGRASVATAAAGRRTIKWYLRDGVSPGPPSTTVAYGTSECSPVAGDWDGDGADTTYGEHFSASGR